MNAPDIASLNKGLNELNGRIDRLEAAYSIDAAKNLELLSSRHAMREALLQFTQEVAARDGFPVELFVSRFEAAKEWHRDRFLQMIEGVDPHIAAEIDERRITDVPTDDLPPCIFPE